MTLLSTEYTVLHIDDSGAPIFQYLYKKYIQSKNISSNSTVSTVTIVPKSNKKRNRLRTSSLTSAYRDWRKSFSTVSEISSVEFLENNYFYDETENFLEISLNKIMNEFKLYIEGDMNLKYFQLREQLFYKVKQGIFSKNYSLLHASVIYDDIESIEIILDFMTNLKNLIDSKKQTQNFSSRIEALNKTLFEFNSRLAVDGYKQLYLSPLGYSILNNNEIIFDMVINYFEKNYEEKDICNFSLGVYNKEAYGELQCALINQNIYFTEQLFKKGFCESLSKLGMVERITYSSSKGKVDCIFSLGLMKEKGPIFADIFIKYGVDLSLCVDNSTLLHICIRNNNPLMLKYILENINIKENFHLINSKNTRYTDPIILCFETNQTYTSEIKECFDIFLSFGYSYKSYLAKQNMSFLEYCLRTLRNTYKTQRKNKNDLKFELVYRLIKHSGIEIFMKKESYIREDLEKSFLEKVLDTLSPRLIQYTVEKMILLKKEIPVTKEEIKRIKLKCLETFLSKIVVKGRIHPELDAHFFKFLNISFDSKVEDFSLFGYSTIFSEKRLKILQNFCIYKNLIMSDLMCIKIWNLYWKKNKKKYYKVYAKFFIENHLFIYDTIIWSSIYSPFLFLVSNIELDLLQQVFKKMKTIISLNFNMCLTGKKHILRISKNKVFCSICSLLSRSTGNGFFTCNLCSASLCRHCLECTEQSDYSFKDLIELLVQACYRRKSWSYHSLFGLCSYLEDFKNISKLKQAKVEKFGLIKDAGLHDLPAGYELSEEICVELGV
eukprot:snap_masked-scaffold_1-processed-gene-1.6-mRNA-1 protein AED:1.00 eAED:1.00 QI:0/-1/0/0/-1/1/1/0/777